MRLKAAQNNKAAPQGLTCLSMWSEDDRKTMIRYISDQRHTHAAKRKREEGRMDKREVEGTASCLQ